jgi:thiamine pyrophosphate-dependent acetolactate synthase large subunit-like protein
LGLRYGVEDAIKSADVILVLDCDVPWINTQCHPNADAKIYHVDVDPLKQQMPVFYLNALSRYRADSYNAVTQLHNYISSTEELKQKVADDSFDQRWTKLQESYKQRIDTIKSLAAPGDDGTYSTSYLMSRVRHFCPKDTIWAIEAVTQTAFVADQIQATIPGSWLNCGGGGLGWSGGGALGIKLATDKEGGKKFVCQVVGGTFVESFWKEKSLTSCIDGTYLFSVPGSVYWIAKRYNIPILTIVLNNKGKVFVPSTAFVQN